MRNNGATYLIRAGSDRMSVARKQVRSRREMYQEISRLTEKKLFFQPAFKTIEVAEGPHMVLEVDVPAKLISFHRSRTQKRFGF